MDPGGVEKNNAPILLRIFKYLNKLRIAVLCCSDKHFLNHRIKLLTHNGRILVICVLWRNAEGDLKDKQMGDFILIMGLKCKHAPKRASGNPYALPHFLVF